jgi:hypothetical protein
VIELTDRELHLAKKALAIAVLAIERHPGPYQPTSDQPDMKGLLDRLIETDTEFAPTRERRGSLSLGSQTSRLATVDAAFGPTDR